MNKLNGFLYGIISSASFGLIPLFAIPAMQHGMDFMNVITYRFLFATIALAILLKVRKVSFAIEKSDLPTCCYFRSSTSFRQSFYFGATSSCRRE